MATEEINIGLMDQIIEARGDYLVDYIDVAMNVDQAAYPIPSRAHGDKLRSLTIVDADGKVVYDNLNQITMDIPSELRTANTFHMENNKVVLNEHLLSSDDYYLRMKFYIRPNKLVQAARAGTITDITDNGDDTTTITLATMPSHFTSLLTYDIVSFQSPNKIVRFSLTPSGVNTTTKTITFASSLLDEVEVGDYVTKAEETIVPNIPTEFHPVVAQRVAVACLEALGDEQNKQSAERKLAQMEKSVLKIVTNRVEGQPKKIRQTNSPLLSALKNRNRTY